MSEATQSEDTAAQRAAEQARLRKERREAKLKAGGSARLNKITGLGGRVPGDPEPAVAITTATDAPLPAPTPAVSASVASPTADH
ncbi:GET subunit GET2, partial [Fusarium heterosporum]